jgi:hypothetical protein
MSPHCLPPATHHTQHAQHASTHPLVQLSSPQHTWLVVGAALLKLHLQPRLQPWRLAQLQLQGE